MKNQNVIPTPTTSKRRISASRLITLVERGLAKAGRPGRARLVPNPFEHGYWMGRILLEVRENTGHVLHHDLHGMTDTAPAKSLPIIKRHIEERALHPQKVLSVLTSANGDNPIGDWLAYATSLDDSISITHAALHIDDVGREKWRVLTIHPEAPVFGKLNERICWAIAQRSAARRKIASLRDGIVVSGMTVETTLAVGGGVAILASLRARIEEAHDKANLNCDETTSVGSFRFTVDGVEYTYGRGRLSLWAWRGEIGGLKVSASASGIKIPKVLSQQVALACAGKNLDDVVKGTPWGHLKIRSVVPKHEETIFNLEIAQVRLRDLEAKMGPGPIRKI